MRRQPVGPVVNAIKTRFCDLAVLIKDCHLLSSIPVLAFVYPLRYSIHYCLDGNISSHIHYIRAPEHCRHPQALPVLNDCPLQLADVRTERLFHLQVSLAALLQVVRATPGAGVFERNGPLTCALDWLSLSKLL